MKTILFCIAVLASMISFDVKADTLIGTPITHLPFSISKPGKYRLAKDLVMTKTSGNAISVTTDNVVIDFNGYTLTATGSANVSSSIGVNINSSHVKVSNGTIIGFGVAVGATLSNGANPNSITVEDMNCDSQLGFAALDIECVDAVLVRCHVTNSSGATSTPIGIISNFSGVIEDCTVTGLQSVNSTVTGFAINNFGGQEMFTQVLRHCVVSDLSATGGSVTTYGVIGAAENTVIDSCSFFNLNNSIQPAGGGTVIVKNSTFRACGASFGGTDGGSNTIAP
jgi:hypothetical protein